MRKYKIPAILIFIISGMSFSAYGQADSLSRYIEIAGQNNPAVKAVFHTYEAALQKIPQMGALEDPQLDMGFFLQPMELMHGRQIAQFQLMQMFPWFGVRKAARTEAQRMAQMAFESFRETRDNLFLEVYTQWYALCGLVQKQNNNEENKKLLQQLESLVLQQNVNKSTSGMSEVLQIQIEIAELESNIESVRSELFAGKIKFNALLNRRPESEVVLPDEIRQIPFSFNAEEIPAMIAENNPMLGMVREETAAYSAKLEMEKKMSYPMFGIGLQYMLMEKKPENSPAETTGSGGSMNSMNGKDMLMPMVSVSIPIYRNKYKAARRENKLLQQAGEEKYADTFNRLRAELYQLKFQLDDAERKIELYRKQTTMVRSICELKSSEFLTGKSDLNAVLQIQRQLLDYRLKESDAIVNYNTLAANIQKLVASNK